MYELGKHCGGYLRMLSANDQKGELYARLGLRVEGRRLWGLHELDRSYVAEEKGGRDEWLRSQRD
jgi:hypothetical protein